MIKWLLILSLFNGQTGVQSFDTKDKCFKEMKILKNKIDKVNSQWKNNNQKYNCGNFQYCINENENENENDINWVYMTCQEGISSNNNLKIEVN